jgi:hypothetical protein
LSDHNFTEFPQFISPSHVRVWHFSEVPLESGMRTKADLRRPLWIYGFTPWLSRAYESELRTGYERNMLSRRVVICPSGGFLTGLSSLISEFPKNISVPT